MFKSRWMVALGAAAFCSASVEGGTLAQYTFEDNPAGTSSTATPQTITDSSGNNRDLVKGVSGGTLSWTNDLASVQPGGTTSLLYNAAASVETAATTDFSFASTGQLTVEFWYKPDLSTSLHGILDYGTGANGWGLIQEVPGGGGAAAGTFNLEFGYNDNSNTFRKINTATTFTTSSPWTHVALTINTTTGDIAIYFNGVEDAATSGVDENIDSHTYVATSYTLRLGQLQGGSAFSNRMYIDDLRISDTVLLPGSGSGDGELAWNTTLVPEPGSVALFGLGACALFRRR